MKFGENTQLVEEVMDFIRNHKMFNKYNFPVNNVEVMNDFSKAQTLAWSRDSNEVDAVWEYVKLQEAERIVEKVYDLDLVTQQDDLVDFFNDRVNYSDDFLPFDYIDINEEVEGDLTMCALNRLVNGKTENFHEKLFQVYKQGAWPCGWKGKYPAGKIIVYVP
ncbi:cytoplasmic protein [Jeotgalibacillus sp. ET6]|uniref:cytoplasmic protein n=1 Tax=Jeotgalibacillus sp. ET6 TaxID=3037260 RepID=UPI0024181EF3|nr:cytoplasmic protein [Jeotgalibacillus sp. ET6]MDG5471417.1 cytoplasmic protein [Jeotgalibacillus sp. ET6]